MDTYAKRLTAALEKAHLTQTDLANMLKIKPQSVQYLCSKGTKSTYTNAIARALNINADWLDTGIGDINDDMINKSTTAIFPLQLLKESAVQPLNRAQQTAVKNIITLLQAGIEIRDEIMLQQILDNLILKYSELLGETEKKNPKITNMRQLIKRRSHELDRRREVRIELDRRLIQKDRRYGKMT